MKVSGSACVRCTWPHHLRPQAPIVRAGDPVHEEKGVGG